jgi:hypothetical protein
MLEFIRDTGSSWTAMLQELFKAKIGPMRVPQPMVERGEHSSRRQFRSIAELRAATFFLRRLRSMNGLAGQKSAGSFRFRRS